MDNNITLTRACKYKLNFSLKRLLQIPYTAKTNETIVKLISGKKNHTLGIWTAYVCVCGAC